MTPATTLLTLAPVFPLLCAALALVPSLRPRLLDLLPLAALPALLALLVAPDGTTAQIPYLLFDTHLVLGAENRLFLLLAALLWTAAGVYARASMAGSENLGRFVGFWCLTLSGNLGTFLAGDVASFYVFFAAVSLAAYPLVVHSGTPEARRAGRFYIALAILGETALLVGFLLAAAEAPSLAIPDVAAGLAASPWRDAALAAVLVGLGIKAGLVPLHIWLPLAHPAAPVPASAVLSGAIVKAGIFGLVQFLPFTAAFGPWPALLLAAGLVTAFTGIVLGVTQTRPKTILAYSTVSQMGLLVAAIATAFAAPDPAPVLLLVALYALHHGLAKGALFLGAGLAAAAGRDRLPWLLAALALPALSIAGLPLLGGALAKLAIKPPFGGGLPELLVTLSAAGTALVLLNFLRAAAKTAASDPASRPSPALLAPFLALALLALFLPWPLFSPLSGQPLAYPFAPLNLWTALWPLLLAAALVLFARHIGFRPPSISEGDLAAPLSGLAAPIRAAYEKAAAGFRPPPLHPIRIRPEILDGLERRLTRWSTSGILLLLVALLALF